MPHLAFDIDFCAQLSKLQGSVKQGVFEAWEKFERLTLDQLFKDQGLKLETLKRARDPHIRTIRIDQGTRGVVLAPDSGDTYVLLRVLPHDKAIAWAIKQKASINTVTRAVEIRDIAMLDELTPAYERIAPATDQRLFAKVSDGRVQGGQRALLDQGEDLAQQVVHRVADVHSQYHAIPRCAATAAV